MAATDTSRKSVAEPRGHHKHVEITKDNYRVYPPELYCCDLKRTRPTSLMDPGRLFLADFACLKSCHRARFSTVTYTYSYGK